MNELEKAQSRGSIIPLLWADVKSLDWATAAIEEVLLRCTKAFTKNAAHSTAHKNPRQPEG
jgi:hypothetical protein